MRWSPFERRQGSPFERTRERKRWARRVLVVFAAIGIAVAAGPACFIAARCYGSGPAPAAVTGALAPFPDAPREESFTFLTLPEWLIVYSADDYGRFIERKSPGDYPYVGAVYQYWSAYDSMCRVTRNRYPFQMGYHVMLGVIGASFTVENLIKVAYESSIGTVSEWISSRDTPEDDWAIRTAKEYGAFMHTVPWYQFPFRARLVQLWSDTPFWGPNLFRKWERRAALSAEYGAKAIYGWMIGMASGGAYDPEAELVYAHVARTSSASLQKSGVKVVQQIDAQSFVVQLPRYEAFTKAALALEAGGARFVSIAGNDDLLITALAPSDLDRPPLPGQVVARLPLYTDPTRNRLAVRVPLSALSDVMALLRAQGAVIEHLYDY